MHSQPCKLFWFYQELILCGLSWCPELIIKHKIYFIDCHDKIHHIQLHIMEVSWLGCQVWSVQIQRC